MSFGRIRFELAFWSILLVVVSAATVVVAAVEGAWLLGGIAGIFGLLLSRSLVRTWKEVDDLHLEDIPDDSPDMFGEPSELMMAIDEFEDAIRNAAAVPLTDQIRLDRRTVDVLLDRIRTTPGQSAAVAVLVDQLDELLRRAKPIPLTSEIRLDREEIYDVLDQIRANIGDERSQLI